MHILMVAAENGALPGGKVGGIGDVIRDLPQALAARGHKVSVVMPGYQHFSKLSGAEMVRECAAPFAGRDEPLAWFTVPSELEGVSFLVVENPLFAACGEGKIAHRFSSFFDFALRVPSLASRS